MAKRTTKAKVENVEKGLYKATLKVLRGTYSGEGETINEALSSIEPGSCKGRGVITVERDGKRAERIVMPVALSRAYNGSRVMREMGIKSLALALKIS